MNIENTGPLPVGVTLCSQITILFRSTRKIAVCVFFVGLSLISSLASSYGYSLEGKTWPANSVVALQFGLGNPPGQLRDGNTSWNAAAMPVVAMWNGQMSRARVTGITNSAVPVVSGDHINAVVFTNNIFGQSFGQGTLAVTYYRTMGANLTEADVLFNKNQQFDSYRGPLQFGSNGYAIGDIRRVLLHELGHGLGLDHPDSHGQQVDAVMNSIVSNRETLSADDVRGIQSLYGASAGNPPPTGTSLGILWQNNSTGERYSWGMTGTTHTSSANLGTVSTQWNMATSADFNGDGERDIVWENIATGARSVWLMDGASHTGSIGLGTVSVQWKIASAADFNGDGKTDLVWQNSSTGARAIWLMNGTNHIGTVNLGTVSNQWKITSASDFDADGKADILWQNPSTGDLALWLMNGTSYGRSVGLGRVAAGWNVGGMGEFNADGKRDILWQNDSTGARAIWLMNGASHLSSASLGTIAPLWNIKNY